MSALPSLSEVQNARWDYLSTYAANWRKLADSWEQAFTEVRNQSMRPGGTEWTGAGADAAQGRTDGDMMRARDPAEQLRDAAGIAERGRGQQEASRQSLLSTVDDTRSSGFDVAEDYQVTDTETDWATPEEYLARQTEAREYENYINARVGWLVDGENDLSRDLNAATQGLDNFAFPAEEGDGGAGAVGTPQTATLVDDVKPAMPAPEIVGVTPGGTPAPEQKTTLTDLDVTHPGWDHTVTGDGHSSPPLMDGKPNNYPLPIDPIDGQRRGLPTGSGIGPDGKPLVTFGTPGYGQKDVPLQHQQYTTPTTEVLDYSDPANPRHIGTLPMSQASVYYNEKERQMVIVGNDGAQAGAPRKMWTVPVDPNNPGNWIDRVPSQGTLIPGGGDRENQYYPLKGGGVMLVDATNGGGVRAFTAADSNGLTLPGVRNEAPIANNIAPPTSPPLPAGVPPGSTWNYSPAYGATVVNDVVNGSTETVTVRVSSYVKVDPPPGVELPADFENYFPQTFLYNVQINHPAP
ncbi:hypothetical protein KIH27_16455 [Mycobacterium sp. M1]|uniref:ESX-1 secretion-associated protein EspA/EspE-like domain-containing protein n=1 Tax=Mycolicibacter acidiphilus TaxID=2835306 RepID=A0ABS5RLJ5_9MYCO|nr:hypothetical protein [Mycolicibacter acidiphilus]MBS9535180.1 hypothetical protein [Mycolicibacter acidiphilus]